MYVGLHGPLPIFDSNAVNLEDNQTFLTFHPPVSADPVRKPDEVFFGGQYFQCFDTKWCNSKCRWCYIKNTTPHELSQDTKVSTLLKWFGAEGRSRTSLGWSTICKTLYISYPYVVPTYKHTICLFLGQFTPSNVGQLIARHFTNNGFRCKSFRQDGQVSHGCYW